MNQILFQIIKDAAIPGLVPVRRTYPDHSLPDVRDAVLRALQRSTIEKYVRENARVAVTVGSRGIANLPEIVRTTVFWFRAQGAAPFIVPAMGSHGGATAEGQTAVLRELGVTEESCGCPVRSSMEVTQVGALPEGLPVYSDSVASGADAVFILNRIKPHTSFSGKHESGLAKMIVIGLGKQRGADSCHLLGFGRMAEIVPRMAELVIRAIPIVGALGIVENAYEKTEIVEAVTAGEIMDCDARLLKSAEDRMPALPVKNLDVLILDEMGKNISGSGMDGNITGRFATSYRKNDMTANKVAVLDLTPESEGNATGMGNADIITERLFGKIDFVSTYANALTTTLFKTVFTPMIIDTDENAFRCAVKTCNAGREAVKLLRIKNTLCPLEMLVSPAVAESLKMHKECAVSDTEIAAPFSEHGELLDRDIWQRFDDFF
jgi:hypothetical protein